MLKSFALLLAAFVLAIYAASSNYSYDGTGNNLANPIYGKSGLPILYKAPVVFDDGISVPVGGNPSTLPSPRLISNLVFGRVAAGSRPRNPRLVSDMLTFWGQFIAHDLDDSPDTLGPNCDAFPIPIPKGDTFYDVQNTGTQQMTFCRTQVVAGTGNSTSNPRRQPNVITAWIDGSGVYGSTDAWVAVLRTNQGGLLKTQPGPDGDLLPFNDNGNGGTLTPGNSMANPAKRVPQNKLYAAGDPRANENPVLTSMHTLFVREHNRRAKALPDSMSDEEKFQTARRFVIAHIQAITFNEYLPTLIGQTPPAYAGYNPNLDPQIYNEFSTVAFRYGHDEVSSIITRFRPDGRAVDDGNILVRDAYFWPNAVLNDGIGPYIRGAAVNQQNALDCMIDEDLRTFLFALPPGLATDLAARNIQRGRDHGVSRYNDVRKAYGLPTCTTFSCITSDPAIQKLLSQAYGNDNVAALDPYVGGLLEDRNANSTNLGPLFTAIILEQLLRVRDADRFWYENAGVFTSSELDEIKSTKLATIIRRNTDTQVLPDNVFSRENVAPAVALGAGNTNNTGWIAAVVVLTIIAAILIIVVIAMCFSKPKERKKDDNLYENLLENK